MTNSSSDVTAAERFYAASGPMATSVMECDSHYYAECLMSGRGAVTVWLSSGEREHIAGTRYLDVERLRAEENEGALEIIYLGAALVSGPRVEAVGVRGQRRGMTRSQRWHGSSAA